MPALILPADFPRRMRPAGVPARMATVQARGRPLPATLDAPDCPAGSSLLAALSAVMMRYGQLDPFSLCIGQPAPDGTGVVWQRVHLQVDPGTHPLTLLREAGIALQQLAPLQADDPVTVGLLTCALPRDPDPAGVAARLELLIAVETDTDGTFLQAAYDVDVFLPARIRRLLGHVVTLSHAMAAEPLAPLATLGMLAPTELAQLQGFGDGGPSCVDAHPASLHRQFEDQAAARPAAQAVLSGGTWFTYGAINRAANQLARTLEAAAVGPGQRVVTLLEPSVDVLVTLLAIFKTGACYVPIDPAYPIERIETILADVQATALIAPADLPAARTAAFKGVRLPPADVSVAEHLPDIADPHGPSSDAQPAVVIFTSGTTGKPKGVELSHGNLRHYLGVAGRMYGYDASDCVAAFARPTFSITFFETFAPLLVGGRLCILPRAVILDFPALLAQLRQVTAFHASPSLLRKLTNHLLGAGIGPEQFQHLRHVSSGGDLVAPDLIETLKQVFDRAELYVIYGCSEISCMGCTYPVPRNRTVHNSFVGHPFPGMQVRVLDANGQPMPLGIPGDIHFAGAGVALGYLNQPDLTAERFPWIDGQRFYRTGDIGRMHEDGTLEILGRADFQIKLRGIRIELGEIEAHLRRIPGIRECVVNACALPSGETGLTAYVVMRESCVLDRRAVRQTLGHALPDYMVPAAMIVLPALPVNFNNKLDRKALPLPTHHHMQQRAPYVAPRTRTEQALAALWEQLLGVPEPGIHEDFFDLGGDSLLTIPLMVEIEAQFGLALPLTTMLTAPTIALLAGCIERDDAEVYAPLLLRAGQPGFTPLVCIHEGNGEVISYRNLAQLLPAGHAVHGLLPLGDPLVPMRHTRITDAVRFYATQIAQLHPTGPLALCGMCVGGFLALEVARALQATGRDVQMVAMVDTAHVTVARTQIRAQVTADQLWRASVRGSADVASSGQVQRRPARLRLLDRLHRMRHWLQRQRARLRTLYRLRMYLLRWHVDHHWPIPSFLQRLSVNTVLRFAEREYVTPARPYPGKVLLLLATLDDQATQGGQDAGIPYRDYFADPLMGWQGKAQQLEVHHVHGRHASVLQVGNVRQVADILSAELTAAASRPPAHASAPAVSPITLDLDPR